jgi:16S rRNA (guanine(966)-N(2))-methyltransferase RsmD
MPAKPARHAVRIIGGQWKRTPLTVLDAPGLRPTPDRVRETVFNWLLHLRGTLAGTQCLDLFAGSGALGFEAASRGAARVVMVEQQRSLVHALMAQRAKLKAEVLIDVRQGMASAALNQLAGQRFNCVFLDPPYELRCLPQILLALPSVLAEDALVYAEDREPLDALIQGQPWQLLRQDRAGQVNFGLLRYVALQQSSEKQG